MPAAAADMLHCHVLHHFSRIASFARRHQTPSFTSRSHVTSHTSASRDIIGAEFSSCSLWMQTDMTSPRLRRLLSTVSAAVFHHGPSHILHSLTGCTFTRRDYSWWCDWLSLSLRKHSFMDWLIDWLIDWLTDWLTDSFVRSIHSFMYSCIHSFIHSFIHVFFHTIIHPLLHHKAITVNKSK